MAASSVRNRCGGWRGGYVDPCDGDCKFGNSFAKSNTQPHSQSVSEPRANTQPDSNASDYAYAIADTNSGSDAYGDRPDPNDGAHATRCDAHSESGAALRDRLVRGSVKLAS